MYLQHHSFVWLVTKFLHTVATYVAFANFDTNITIIIMTAKNEKLLGSLFMYVQQRMNLRYMYHVTLLVYQYITVGMYD